MSQPGVRRTVVILVALVAVVIGLTVSRVMREPQIDQQQLLNLGLVVRDNPGEIQEFSLVDHHGAVFDKTRLEGQWSLIYFGYTFCPDICPTTLAQMMQMKMRLEKEGFNTPTQYLLVSVDPDRDTQERLEQYVTYFDPEFIGVTGELLKIHSFALNLNSIFAKMPLDDSGNYLMDHTGNIVVVDPQGRYYGFFKPPFNLANMTVAYKAVAK